MILNQVIVKIFNKEVGQKLRPLACMCCQKRHPWIVKICAESTLVVDEFTIRTSL